MRVLVDTSAWSQWFRQDVRYQNPVTNLLERSFQRNEEIYLTALVVQEVLQGLRQDREFQRVRHLLDAIPLLPVDREQAVLAAKIRRQCAAKGITASSVDCQIAAVAIAYDCLLLSTDKDFDHIAQHTDLQLLKDSTP